MYHILNCRQDGPVLYFTFANRDDDFEWQHVVCAQPWVDWYSKSLLPLAEQRGDSLQPSDLLDEIEKQAAAQQMPLAAIDWLALALWASQAYRVAAVDILRDDSPAAQRRLAAADLVRTLLGRMADRYTQIVQSRLRADLRGAA
jgi:hypothetical protein